MSEATTLKAFSLLLRASAGEREFYVTYEVIAHDAEEAARLAIGDLAGRGEKALDVEHVEAARVANPLTPVGVRFRTGRAFFDDPA